MFFLFVTMEKDALRSLICRPPTAVYGIFRVLAYDSLRSLHNLHHRKQVFGCRKTRQTALLRISVASTNAFGVRILQLFAKKRTPIWCSFFGSGRRIRTLTNRVRVCRATLTQSRYFELKKSWCRRRDLNPHGIATTTPSK